MSKAYTRAKKGDSKISSGSKGAVARGHKEPSGRKSYNDGKAHNAGITAGKKGRFYK